MVKTPLKWPGGKAYLANWIVSLMPPRDQWLHYVEPYFGGGAVLLANNPEGISEVVNDLNGHLTNFWRCLQSSLFEEFKRTVEATPFSERVWKNSAHMDFIYPSATAAAFFIRCRQSLAGRMDSFTGITKTRTRRGMNNEASAWLSAIEGLPAVHARLKRVLILDAQPALKVIAAHDGPQTLFYLDPPYVHEARATTKEYGEFEMTTADHEDLCDIIAAAEGKIMLSGYRNVIYDERLSEWNRHEKRIPNHAAGGKTKRVMTECVWTNF